MVGSYLLSQLNKIPRVEIGLYKDDGLAVLQQTPRATERIKKEICHIFRKCDLKITVEANKKVVNFLDVTLDLNTEKFKPYSKTSNTPLYVHSKSNHPPNIIRNIPESVRRRLSEISSDKFLFNETATPYQDALYKSGYKYKLEFKPPQRAPCQRRNRSRKTIWFNPPYNKNVKSKIRREFLRLIDNCFPAGHTLRKIFNRNTLKLSYSCIPNVQQILKGHNKSVLANSAQPTPDQAGERACKKKKKKQCPLEGNCLAKGIVYQAQVTSGRQTETYVGLTATEFKSRFRNHQMSFNNEMHKNDTELSKHTWQLKSNEQRFTIKWKILAKVKIDSNLTKRCNLCTTEKHS